MKTTYLEEREKKEAKIEKRRKKELMKNARQKRKIRREFSCSMFNNNFLCITNHNKRKTDERLLNLVFNSLVKNKKNG
jgi:hypothetical protein